MERIKQHIYISNLLSKKSLGILSDEEVIELQAWLDRDVDNYKIIEELQANLRQDIKKEPTDVKVAWERFQHAQGIKDTPIKRISSQNWWRVAGAAAAVLFGAGLLWLSSSNDNLVLQQSNIQTADIKSLSIYKDHKGILLLSGGETKELEGNNHPDSSYNLSRIMTLAHDDKNPAIEEDQINTIVVPKGAEFKVKLPDGTIAWINSGSSLAFPTRFATLKREVTVTGEVCLDVAHSENQPFIVNLQGQQIRVLGTLFNMEAYDGYAKKTTLVRGKIEVQAAGKSLILKPNEQLVQQVDGQTAVHTVTASESIQWIEGNFEFNDENIVDILTKLSRWYDVSFSFVSLQKKSGRFTLQVERKEALADVLHKLELTGAIRFQIKDKHILVF